MKAQTDSGLQAPWRRDAFWRSFLHATTPLAIWAGHFFTAYAFVAIGCRAGLDTRTLAGIPVLTLGLGALTVLALAWLAIIIAKAAGVARASGGRTGVRSGIAILSFVAVAWTALPIALFTSCLR